LLRNFMTLLILCCVAVPCMSQQIDDERLNRGVSGAAKYVLSQLGDDGLCAGEYPKDDYRYGTKTIFCAYALLMAETDYRQTPKLRNTIQWALDAKLKGTKAVALRLLMLSALNDKRAHDHIVTDVKWLMAAGYKNGAYTHESVGGVEFRPGDNYDNGNAFWASLGMWAAVQRGVEIGRAHV